MMEHSQEDVLSQVEAVIEGKHGWDLRWFDFVSQYSV